LFNQKNDNEIDFCESYKSQILGNDNKKEENSFFSIIVKLLSILILLVIIIGVSFYGYNYFMNNQKTNKSALPPVSIQISDDDLIVKMQEDSEPEKIEKVIKQENISIPTVKTVQVEEKNMNEIVKDEIVIIEENISIPPLIVLEIEEDDIDKIARDMKIEISKIELKEENETKPEKISEDIQSKRELNNTHKIENLEVTTSSAPEARYLEDLAKLSKEIDKERNQ